MSYLSITDFRAGMNRSCERVAGNPGALWTLKDAHINRGGSIERRKRFVSTYALPSGSRFLASVRSQLYTFGSADLSATTPVGVTYQRLQASASSVFAIASGQNAANAETLVIDAKTYTFQTVLTDVDGHILIGASRTATITNLAHAINASGGTPGTDYATSNTIHPTVRAVDRLDGTMLAVAKTAGSAGNSIVVTEALAQGSWTPNSLMAGGNPTLTKILDAKPFQGLLYVIAEYDDGSIYHFYNGTRVSDWDTAVYTSITAEAVAARLALKLSTDSAVIAEVFGAVVTVKARVPGTAFTLTGGTTNGGPDSTQALTRAAVTANVAAVAEVLSSADVTVDGGTSDPGTDTITSIEINGEEVLNATLDWAGSHAATAIRIAAAINNGTALHGYTATVVSATVTITAEPGTGDTPNGYVVAVTTTGSVTVTADATMTGGVDAVAAVAQVDKLTVSGAIEPADTFTATLNSVAYKATGMSSAMGTSLYVDKQHVWSTAGRLWRFCMLATATVWDPANTIADNDAGFIDMAQETEGTDDLTVATRYQNLAAVFSQSFITLWALDPDPTLVAVSDTLDNTGTSARNSIVRYGNNDVFYLDSTGIRSLRARDASNAAFVSDVGNAIDIFVQEILATLTPQEVLDAVGAIDPKDGRYWLAAGGYIFVLSFFPSSKISAWSYYQPDEFDDDPVETIVRAGKRLYVRCGDAVFLYGGVNDDEFPLVDESPVTVELPFLSAGTPATLKDFISFDIACLNEWDIDLLYDPNDEDRTVNIGRITKTTFNEMDLAAAGNSTVVAFKLTCRRAGAASISGLQIGFNAIKEK